MFGIDGSELLVVLIVALVVVGPKDLPKLLRTLGQWAGRARTMADQFKRSFDEMSRQSELDELRAEVNKLKAETSKPMTDADYKSYGIEFPKDPLANIEDVGAAPPKFDEPAPTIAAAATAAPAPASAAPAGVATPAVQAAQAPAHASNTSTAA